MTDINNAKQNRPSLICADLLEKHGVPETSTAAVLMNRGVYKWFAVRRDIIRLKTVWKHQVCCYHVHIKQLRRGSTERREAAAALRTLELCRKQLRELCHSPRWQFPDNDPKGRRLIEQSDVGGKA